MRFGNIEGLVNGTEQVVFDYEVTGSAVSSISTGNILNGDEDGWYTIIGRVIVNDAVLGTLRFNGDSGSNYGLKGIQAVDTAVADNTQTAQDGIPYLFNPNASGQTEFFVARMYAKSGSVRLINGVTGWRISGTTVTGIMPFGGVWANTGSNLTAMSLHSNSGALFGVGTSLTILKSNNFTNGVPTGVLTSPWIKGAWVRVGSATAGSNVSSVTIPNLDGDRDVLYLVNWDTNGGSSSGNHRLTFNTDTSANYVRQYLYADGTSVGTLRSTVSYISMGYAASPNYRYSGSMLLYAKSGFVRPGLLQHMDSSGGTTVSGIVAQGISWNNTGSNITQMVFTDPGGAFILSGSRFDVYALRPNG